MSFRFLAFLILTGCLVQHLDAASSPLRPYMNYTYATELQPNLADLWWSIDENRKEITFEFHVKTTGWIALGISPTGDMAGADIGLGWVDQSGRTYFEDRYAFGRMQPVVDNTTQDWIGLRGREENGWTAIQFKRLLDTCDNMDYPIKAGTNILIYAYGLEDPVMSDGKATISYHGNRRFIRAIPLQSYGNPPADSKFHGLDYFDFQLNNYKIPSTDTTYHCKVYKVPSRIRQRKHAIAHKTIISPGNFDIVHHLLMYECNPTAVFDDNNLPDDVCDRIYPLLGPCSSNIATGWAVGGDPIVEFPEIAGYPVGGDFEIKYYMVQMHYDNPHRMTNRTDSSGIRFYLGNETRQQDLGYLTLGADSSVTGISIPPRTDRFIIDSYCPAIVTSEKFPQTGITIISAFPHTHLQGSTVWTKIIRNKKAERYLFEAEAYDFNYQFENRLPQTIKLYPGDELATRCIYNTMNKDVITLGGEATKDEMCLHMFTYYPRMKTLYGCMITNSIEGFAPMMNASTNITYFDVQRWLLERQWTTQSTANWQAFYNNAPKTLIYGGAGNLTFVEYAKLPSYEDLKPVECKTSGGTVLNPLNFALFLAVMKLML